MALSPCNIVVLALSHPKMLSLPATGPVLWCYENLEVGPSGNKHVIRCGVFNILSFTVPHEVVNFLCHVLLQPSCSAQAHEPNQLSLGNWEPKWILPPLSCFNQVLWSQQWKVTNTKSLRNCGRYWWGVTSQSKMCWQIKGPFVRNAQEGHFSVNEGWCLLSTPPPFLI